MYYLNDKGEKIEKYSHHGSSHRGSSHHGSSHRGSSHRGSSHRNSSKKVSPAVKITLGMLIAFFILYIIYKLTGGPSLSFRKQKFGFNITD